MNPSCDDWAQSPTKSGYRAEQAGLNPIEDWLASARNLFGLPDAEITAVEDPASGVARLACLQNGRLFVSPQPVAVMRGFLTTLPQVPNLGLLSGRAPADMPARVQFCVPALKSARTRT